MRRLDRSPVPRASLRRGFTLIELLGVMVILGLIASVAYVSYESMVPQSVLNSAVRELASALQETRSEAIARSQPFWIEYTFEDTDDHPRGYRIVTPFVASVTGGLAMRPEDRLAQPFVPLPEGVTFREITINGDPVTRGVVSVRFDPLGTATDHTIVLEHRQYDAVYTIEVQALTGLISFHDGVFRREPAKDADFGS
jgi:type II secretion system protein H